ncbi:MAG: rhodanese [Planctomycetaceae bacterium]|nr:rhodanese [Planctomycetaceae bacterium]MBT6485476.1 rhodanese [Planctomycetaceae bacterium]MBT6497272.1 rhodanese [Planctomycetaceae bacterium]
MNNPADSNAFEIDCQSVQSKLAEGADFLLLDCREADEYALVHLPESQLLPMSEIERRIGELDSHREREIVVLCHHGSRSLQVTMWMRQLGFENVKSLAGGIDNWAVAIDPKLPRY